MDAIDVGGLEVDYGDLRAVNGVSFTCASGEVVALLGPNGAGKTSTIETLEGYRRPSAGRVRVLGLDPYADHDRLTPHIGVMLQSPGIYPGIRSIEAIELAAAFFEDPRKPADVLDRIGLSHRARTPFRLLSGGEQQRLSLGMALVGRPDVAFLDEPTAGIDIGGRQLVRTLVDDLRTSGVGVLITTHDLGEAEKTADRVVIMDQGRVAANGTPGELMRSGGSQEIRFGAPDHLDTAALGKAMTAAVERVQPGEYLVHVEPTPANIARLTTWLADRNLPLSDLRAGRQRLEDVFTRLTEITGEVPAIRSEPGRDSRDRGQDGRDGRGAA